MELFFSEMTEKKRFLESGTDNERGDFLRGQTLKRHLKNITCKTLKMTLLWATSSNVWNCVFKGHF